MKVSVKIAAETLFVVHMEVMHQSHIIRGRNAGKSMLAELFEILSKRCIAYSSNPNGKDRTLELRYHLAEKLLQVTAGAASSGRYGVYEHNKLEIFKNELHKKLL